MKMHVSIVPLDLVYMRCDAMRCVAPMSHGMQPTNNNNNHTQKKTLNKNNAIDGCSEMKTNPIHCAVNYSECNNIFIVYSQARFGYIGSVY